MKAAFFIEPVGWIPSHPIDYTYARGRRERLATLCDLHPRVIDAGNFARELEQIRDLEVIFSTWGMPRLTAAQLDQLPRLKVIFYAAGSVAHFARPYLERGVQIVSAKEANADSVAEFCLGQILLGAKGYFRNSRGCSHPEGWSNGYKGPGAYGETVALIGAGAVARKTAALLRGFHLNLLMVDDWLTPGIAAELGAKLSSLDEAFASAFVVSNHLADFPHTRGIIQERHFRAMRTGAVFINTGRGAQVDEPGLVAALRARPDLTALLDVIDPEPPAAHSPLFALPNIHLSSHIAGALNDEALRLADLIIEEFIAYQAGRGLRHTVSLESLSTRA